jgi:hypothetical protein
MYMKPQLLAACALAPLLAACGGSQSATPAPAAAPLVTAPPAGLDKLDYNYYRKHVDAGGVHIVGSADVSDTALLKMKYIVETMMSKDEAVRKNVVARLQRFLLIPKGRGMTSMPEYLNLDQIFPLDGGMTWDARTQGIAWTEFIPYTSCSEANLLHSAYPDDRYPDESICIHEFAHTIWEAGVVFRDAGAQARLEAAYGDAKARGLLGATYAGVTSAEYWAEGVQGWFNAASCRNTPTCNHEKLKQNDPRLWAEIARWFDTPAQLGVPMYP